MAGLVRKKITVRGKKGTYQRSVMVRAGEAVRRTAGKVGRFVNKHKGKIAGAAALAGAAYLGIKHGSKIAGAARGVGMALNTQKHYGEKLSLRERARGVVQGARLGASMNASGDKGRLGRAAAALNRGISHVQDALNRRADSAKMAVAAASPPPPPARGAPAPKPKARKRARKRK